MSQITLTPGTIPPLLKTVTINGLTVPIEGERSLLELIRKADIDLPTFCYHSDLSVYGACRLCLVDIAGRGIQAACSTPPEPGLKVQTNTEEIREIRKIAIELLLANHPQTCPTCASRHAGGSNLIFSLNDDGRIFSGIRIPP